MKKCLIILLILLCSFAVFAAEDILNVTLNVGKSGPYVAFTDSCVSAFTTTFTEASDKTHDTSSGSDISGSVYATITTNSATKNDMTVTVSWGDLEKDGITTEIPLHISSTAVYINGTSNNQSVADSTSSVTLTEPDSSKITGPRAISHKLDYVIYAKDYLKATSANGYTTELTLTATYNN